MPPFFIPYIEDPDKAEEVLAAVRRFMEEQHGWRAITDRRIFRIDYEHGKTTFAEVGEPHPYGHPYTWDYVPDYGDPKAGEWVVAILENEGGPFLVCTHNRGVVRGEPILVGAGSATSIVYFDGYGPDDVGG